MGEKNFSIGTILPAIKIGGCGRIAECQINII
jgi:hypothetical protein